MSNDPGSHEKPVVSVVWDPNLLPLGLVFNVDHIQLFRERYRVLGVLIGTLPPYPQQNVFLSIPLRLLVFECLYLLDLDVANLRLTGPGGETSYLFETFLAACLDFEKKCNGTCKIKAHYDIYRSLLERGYFISPGLKFGGDFVLYPGDPLKFHSYSIVLLNFSSTNDLVVGGRLATGVKKNLVIVDQQLLLDEPFRAYSIQWAGFG